MPNNFVVPPTGKRIETGQFDERGELIAQSIYEEKEVVTADGSIDEVKRGGSFQLSDGLLWNPGLQRGNAPILVAVCPACRKPRLFGKTPHGLVARDQARHCHDCGTLCCPKHRNSRHGKWRCRRCDRKYRRRYLFARLFFK